MPVTLASVEDSAGTVFIADGAAPHSELAPYAYQIYTINAPELAADPAGESRGASLAEDELRLHGRPRQVDIV